MTAAVRYPQFPITFRQQAPVSSNRWYLWRSLTRIAALKLPIPGYLLAPWGITEFRDATSHGAAVTIITHQVVTDQHFCIPHSHRARRARQDLRGVCPRIGVAARTCTRHTSHTRIERPPRTYRNLFWGWHDRIITKASAGQEGGRSGVVEAKAVPAAVDGSCGERTLSAGSRMKRPDAGRHRVCHPLEQ
jgi:hypothetical protein